MKVFVVHVVNAADRPVDYYVHGTLDGALRQAAKDVVIGRYGQRPSDFEDEVRRAIGDGSPKSGLGGDRWYIRCDAWHARIDELEIWP